MTATTIKIGVIVLPENVSSTAENTGAVTPGHKPTAQAVIKYINAHGGMAGRTVIPVYYEYNGANPSWGAEYEAACAALTQDNKVFAVVNPAFMGEPWETLASCVTKTHTPLIWSLRTIVAPDRRQVLKYAPFIYFPSHILGHRWGAIIDRLVAGGYFDKDYKLGVIYNDYAPEIRTYNNFIKPRLAAHGLKITSDASSPQLQSVTDISSSSGRMNQAVLRFRQAGVTHVLFLGVTSDAVVYFQQSAENQGYRPRYALNSWTRPSEQAGSTVFGTAAPEGQLHRALAVGWWPTLDVDAAQDPNDNPTQSLCLRIIRSTGQDLSLRSNAAWLVPTCDGFFFLKTALDRAGAVTAQALRAAVDDIGTAYRSALAFSTRFGPGRFDGGSSVRLLAYDNACRCFKYVGNWVSIP